MAFSSVFAQLQVVTQKQITREKKDEFSVLRLGKKGFVLIQKTKSEEQRKFNTWSFTLYNLQLEEVWTKKTDVENDFIELAKETYDGCIDFILYDPRGGALLSVNTQDLTLIKINSEGEISRKDIEFSNKIRLYPGNFIRDAYYCDVTDKKKDYDEIYKIDFASMNYSSNKLDLPDNTNIFERTTDGEKIYFRIKSTKKSWDYDALYTIEDGIVVEKIPMKKQGNDEMDSLKIIMSDTAHRFVLGLSVNKVLGARRKDDLIDYQYSLTNLQENDIQTINKVNKDFSDQLYNKRDISVTHSTLFNLISKNFYYLIGDYTLISSCFRQNGKNFIVFDKYQSLYDRQYTTVTDNSRDRNGIAKGSTPYYDNRNNGSYTRTRSQSVLVGYLFTNSVVWCFNDDGVVEWSQNFDYAIISPNKKAITSAGPYDEDRIAIVGHFDKELSYKVISMDGKVEQSDEKQILQYNSKSKKDIEQLNNSLIHLYDTYYLVWGTDDELLADIKAKSKKDLKMFFQIVEFK